VGIADAQDAGIPIARMLVVEYCAEPVRPGLFRKCCKRCFGTLSRQLAFSA